MGMWPAMWCYSIGHDTNRPEAANDDANLYADWRRACSALAVGWFDHFQGYCPDFLGTIVSSLARLVIWLIDQSNSFWIDIWLNLLWVFFLAISLSFTPIFIFQSP